VAFDRDRAVLLSMDFQRGILANYAQDADGVVRRAAEVLASARANAVPVIHVVHRGAPVVERPEDAVIAARLIPQGDEQVMTKTRSGPFSTTGLDVLLRQMQRDELILMGIATSGVVLSTVRWAMDLGYRLTIVKDACDDRDPEVHRVLTEKVFAHHRVLTTHEAVALLSGANPG
jgi:nicotinamidase-related amidase